MSPNLYYILMTRQKRACQAPPRCCPVPAAFPWQAQPLPVKDVPMSDRDDIFKTVADQIAPFNKKGVALTEATSFAGDLEWDSLTVMDFVAAIEDEFEIIITMNMQAEIETVGQLVDAVAKLKG
jgi:acyl carrier protein